MTSEIEELSQFLTLDTRIDVKSVALQNVLSIKQILILSVGSKLLECVLFCKQV